MANGCPSGSCGTGGNGNFDKMLKDAKIQDTLAGIKNKIVVLSGKGGVGKSTVAAGIALSLALDGYQVGLLDVDVHGPTIPNLFGLTEARPGLSPAEKMLPLKALPNLKVMSIGFLLQNRKEALIWRGPLKIGLIEQFIYDVEWENLDYLIIDCPPGTGDEPLTIFQLMKDAKAVLVTTPQNVSVIDVEKSVTFCKKMDIEIIGIVENMATLSCPECGKSIRIFPGEGGKLIAKEFNLKLLASLPLSHSLMEKADKGEFQKAIKEAKIFTPIIEEIVKQTEKAEPELPDKRIVKAAIPVNQDGKLSSHFGHAPYFLFVSADTEKKIIVSSEKVKTPKHEPQTIPQWLLENGTDIVLCKKIGEKAETVLQNNKIAVIKIPENQNPEHALISYLKGDFKR